MLLCFLFQAGKALKLVAGATPVFGGLASVAAAALEAGDHSVQTQRVVKVCLGTAICRHTSALDVFSLIR